MDRKGAQPRSLADASRYMLGIHGSPFRAYFGTLTSVILREVPGYAMYFSTYEGLVRYAAHHHGSDTTVPKIYKFLAGGVAGVTMWTLYYPLDFIKSTAQARNARRKSVDKPVSPREIMKSVYQKESIAGFYRGMKPAILRAFPTHACIFLVYETILGLLHNE